MSVALVGRLRDWQRMSPSEQAAAWAALVHCQTGARLRALRGARSVRAFSRELRVSRECITRCESGEPAALELLVVLGERGVRLDWLVFGQGPPIRLPYAPEDFDEMLASWLAAGPWETVSL